MYKFLSKSQRQELIAELRLERSRKYADRIRVILLLDDGEKYRDIAKFLFLDEGSIANYRKRYREGGIEGLINDHYVGKVPLLSPAQLLELNDDLQKEVFPDTGKVIDHVEKKFQVRYSRGGMTDLLHRMGFSFKKPKAVPGKADRKKQEKFIKQYNGVKPHGLVYFADSTHPMFNPVMGYGWIKKGQDFEIKTNSGRFHLNINGAIEINTMNVIARSCNVVNRDSICELLRAIRNKNPEKDKIYLVLDNAPYNRAKKVKKLAKKLKIRLLYLPPYSPNLNPIERLWKFMKKKMMANKYYDTFDDFKHEVMEFFRGIRKYRKELETLITDNFQLMGT